MHSSPIHYFDLSGRVWRRAIFSIEWPRDRVAATMSKPKTNSKERLLDAAELLILEHGFAGTSVAMIVEQAGVTKGSFFHHFDTKADLGHELIERFADIDRQFLEATMDTAEALSRDPLQQLLIFIGLLAEEFQTGYNPLEGCLFAAYIYQQGVFDSETLSISEKAFLRWRQIVADKLDEITDEYSPSIEVDLDSLADSVSVVTEGGFVTARVLRDPQVMADQLIHLRNYLELLFEP